MGRNRKPLIRPAVGDIGIVLNLNGTITPVKVIIRSGDGATHRASALGEPTARALTGGELDRVLEFMARDVNT